MHAYSLTENRIALPSRKNEAWHYTDLKRLIGAHRLFSWRPDAQAEKKNKPDGFSAKPSLEPGVIALLGEGLLAGTLPSNITMRKKPNGSFSSDYPMPMAEIALQLAPEKWELEIEENTQAELTLLHSGYESLPEDFSLEAFSSETLSASAPSIERTAACLLIDCARIDIIVGENAHLTVNEEFSACPHQCQSRISVARLAKNARLDLNRHAESTSHAFRFLAYSVFLAESALCNLVSTENASGGLARSDLNAFLEGEQANCRLSFASQASRDAHLDQTVCVHHRAGKTESLQNWRSTADHKAHSVFQGRIAIDPEASQTDGTQMAKAWLLSPQARASIKPELDIRTDNVKCAHGATVGTADPQKLFYLMARGLDAEQAKRMLVSSFLAEAFQHSIRPDCFERLTSYES